MNQIYLSSHFFSKNTFRENTTAENLSLSQNRKSAQKGDFMAEKGARMAPKGVNRRILAPFGELGKNIVFCNYFLIFFLFLLKV